MSNQQPIEQTLVEKEKLKQENKLLKKRIKRLRDLEFSPLKVKNLESLLLPLLDHAG
jgi:cell division septum initiation protein DivIVA